MRYFLLLFLIFSCSQKKIVKENPPEYSKEYVDSIKINIYSALPQSENDIIFLGDSKTEAFPVCEIFMNKNVKNRGLAGNTSKEILKRIDFIAQGKPNKIIIEFGVNDLINNAKAADIFKNFQLIYYKIKYVSPHTIIIVQSTLPTSKEYKDLNASINVYNKLLKKFCVKYSITFVDSNNIFMKDGQMNSEYTFDGIHLNGLGYAQLGSFLKKYID